MKISLIFLGKTDFDFLKEGILMYENRIKHYLTFEIFIIPDIKNPKNLSKEQIQNLESTLIINSLKNCDDAVLLDENGQHFSSVEFAKFIEKKTISGTKNLAFVIGGAYGFADSVHQKYKQKLSLSKMTFSHQLVRLIFVEQLYRAMTILKNEPYHH